MGYTVSELTSKLTYKEFIEWQAYYEVEPWGSKIEGVRMASNTCAVFNAGLMNASPKQYNNKRSKPKDFFIGVVPPIRRRPTSQELKAKFLAAIPPGRLKKVSK